MNHIYKSVWNEHTGAYVAVSEKTRTKGKRSGSILFKTVAAGILGFCLTGGVANAQSNPNINNVSNLSTTGALSPVMNILGGLTGSQGGAATNLLGGLLDPVLGLVGGLAGGNGGLLGGGNAGAGAITDVQGTVDRLVNNTALTPVGGLVNGLVDPQTGVLAPVTGLVNGLTSATGPLAPVGGLVNGLVGDQGALTPVVGTVNNLLGSLTGGGQSGGLLGGLLGGDQSGGLLGGLLGGDQSGGLLGGLLGGGQSGGQSGGLLGGLLGGGNAGTGAITDVQGTVDRLVNNTVLTPVGGLVNGLVDPQTGVLAPVTGLVNGLTSATGPLAPVGGLVNGLVGDQGALTPVVGTVNNLLGSLTGGGQSGGLLGGLLGGGQSGGLLDGLLGGGQSGGLLGGLLGGGQSGGQSGGLLGGLLGGGQGGGLLGGLLGGGQSGGQSGGLLGGLLGGGQGGGLLGGLLGGGQGGSGNVLDLSTGIVLPQNQLGNTLDTVLTPILKPVEGLVNSLLGTLSPVLNPVLGVVNGITGGLGIELPKDLHLDLVDDLSMALKGEKPLNLEILANNGNILGLADTNSGGGTNPNLPGSDLNAVLYDDASKQKVTLAGGANGTTITNVKAGAVNATSTDAVNGSQLHALDERVTTNTTNITNLDQRVTTNTTNITNLMDGKAGLVQQAAPNAAITVGKDTGGSEVNFSNKEGNARKLTGVQAGAVTATSTEAINGAQLHTTNQSIVATNQAVADALGSDGAKLNSNGIVNTPQYNLSSGQYMSVGAALHGLDQNSIQYDANTNKGNITLGGANGTTITNVKAGAVNKTSTEAINGAQLYATNKSIADALGGNTVVNIDGSISGTTYNINEITQGGVVNNNYTNVGDAFNSVSNSVTNLYNQVNDGKIGLVQQASPNAAITVGKSTGGNEVNFRNESGEARRLTGVAEAVDGTDAVNLDQVTRMVQGATPADLTEVRNDISSLRGDVRRVEKRADAGAATAMAVAGLPQAYLPGKSMVSMAGGVYASESGYALGASTVTENGKWVLKGSVAGSSRGQMGATIGAGYQW